MKTNVKKMFVGSICAPFTLLAASAFSDIEEIDAMSKAKISLVQAIEAATTHSGGKALEASIDDDSAKPEYEVSVLRENRVYDIRVDAETGEVISEREDKDD